jgi:hypothetical protein
MYVFDFAEQHTFIHSPLRMSSFSLYIKPCIHAEMQKPLYRVPKDLSLIR